MARIQYGTTIWGAELLKVLERKTDYGRLGRGRTYANTGRVYDVSVKKSHIGAKVEGNYSPYYSTDMDFTPFSKDEIESIKTILEDNPLILASIMNGDLPESFLKLLLEAKISLFENFNMSCSCPDFWGEYACKHIAGLYYIAVSEMDKNPFILFSLRGFDLIEYYGIESEINIEYPLSLTPYEEQEVSSEPLEIIKLQDSSNFILSMLSSNPPFASIDYKEVMEEFYKKVPRALAYNITAIQSRDIEAIERLFQNADFEFLLDYNIYDSRFDIKNPLLAESGELFQDMDAVFKKDTMSLDISELFRLFISFEDDSGSESYRFLFYLFRVAYLMIEAKAFIPAVIEDKKSFTIVYRPLHSIPQVQEQLSSLSKMAPKIVKYKTNYLDQNCSTDAILSAVISDFATGMGFIHRKQNNNPPAITWTFFHAKVFKVKGFEEENLASSIYNYFAVFDIVKSKYRYKYI